MHQSGQHPIEIWRVNAFTETPFTGNPAGVVPRAEGLSDTLMQCIAKEVNDISETVFILPADSADADLRLRFFTATTEVDLCGHATISALFALHWRGDITCSNQAGKETRILRAQTRVGVLELGLSFEGGRLLWATMEQLTPQMAPATGAHRAAEVLGLPPAAIAHHPEVACCSSGLWVCFVPLTDVAQLARIELQRELIEQLSPDNPDLAGVYAFAFVDAETTQGRFFSLAKYGILEDPVTGTASGALGGYLIANQLMPASGMLYARQGVEMGRPGWVHVRQNPNGRMSISGRAVAIIRGHLLV
jgi:trans-2,3-dihydro-3-hydroxyanthranilate isomerase